MTDIFISHVVADKALADKFVAFLKEAIGVPAKSIFCSSIDGQNIPLGDDFNEYMKKQIQKPKLVILLMTPRYMESWFCLMELGATWAQSLKALPVVVPPIQFDVISSTLGLKQGWSIDNNAKLIDLRQMVQATGITLEHRTEHDWEKKRAVWKADLGGVDKRDSQGGLIVIQAGICDGDQLGTRPDVGRGMGLSRALHPGDPSPERAQGNEPSPCSGWDFLGRADWIAVA